ncbi:Pectinesterase protein [Dioscorea alata]|uniref:Pectinesterase protein n=1 Tax=Dioscorea alata TaxID=55571 RepID=A0ACB7VQC4_DIOAL|nr:Pectinesterase protein [Dioscorea alata]
MSSKFNTNLPFFTFILILFFSACLSDDSPATPVNAGAACNLAPDPIFCKQVLPPNKTDSIYNYSRFSFAKSLLNAQKFANLINQYLSRPKTLTSAALQALRDCQFLCNLNIEFLIASSNVVNSTTNLLDPQTELIHTLLSALLTNQQTCLESLQSSAQAWSTKNGITSPLFNGSKLYSVSLALFTKAWVPNKKKKSSKNSFVSMRVPQVKDKKKKKKPPHHGSRSLLFHEVDLDGDSGLPLKMSDEKRHAFGRRKLLNDSSDPVLVANYVVVSQDGSGNFTNITDAINSAPNNNNGSNGYYLIYVTEGVYEEYVNIPSKKMYIIMIGDGINQTVITGNRSVGDGWTTFNSATFIVTGQGFVGISLSIRNTAGAVKGQAVALRNGADLSTFYDCSFEGYQDTLYTHSLRQFYRECDVYGTVDFIFGNAAVVFQNCNIYSRVPIHGQSNTITAQGRTDPNQNTGTSMLNCSLLAGADLAASPGAAITYLGRPWKMYSRTVIMQSFMDSLIDPTGWMPWNGTFAIDTLYYGEYANRGPGSDTSKRVNWPGVHPVMNRTDAANYTVSNFLLGDNWLPPTGVPYFSGLL